MFDQQGPNMNGMSYYNEDGQPVKIDRMMSIDIDESLVAVAAEDLIEEARRARSHNWRSTSALNQEQTKQNCVPRIQGLDGHKPIELFLFVIK